MSQSYGRTHRTLATQNTGGGWTSCRVWRRVTLAQPTPARSISVECSYAAFDGSKSGANQPPKTIGVKKWDVAQWLDVSGGLAVFKRVPSNPQLSTAGGAMNLVWIEDQLAAKTGNSTTIYATRWNGTQFVEQLRGDASAAGIHGSYAAPTSLALATDPTGNPVVVWADRSPGGESIYLRTNTTTIGQVYYVNDDNDAGDVFSTNLGSDTNSGLTPNLPKQTIQAVLGQYTLGPNDVILCRHRDLRPRWRHRKSDQHRRQRDGRAHRGTPDSSVHRCTNERHRAAGDTGRAEPGPRHRRKRVFADAVSKSHHRRVLKSDSTVAVNITASPDPALVGNVILDASDGLTISGSHPVLIGNQFLATGGTNVA